MREKRRRSIPKELNRREETDKAHTRSEHGKTSVAPNRQTTDGSRRERREKKRRPVLAHCQINEKGTCGNGAKNAPFSNTKPRNLFSSHSKTGLVTYYLVAPTSNNPKEGMST